MILALDQSASRTGWVRGEARGPVHIGSFELDTDRNRYDMGRMLEEFERKAMPLFQGVDKVFFEAPIMPFGMQSETQILTLRRLYSIASYVELMARRVGAVAVEVNNTKHKQLIYGHGGAKPLNATTYAKAWGLPARNADEADACGIFLYGIQNEYPAAFTGWVRIRKKHPPIQRLEPPKKKKRGSKKAAEPKQKKARQPGPSLFD